MTSYWFARHQPPPASRHDSCPDDVDVVVIGAGITGLASALLLARSGRRVVLLEARHIGAVTTGHTSGKISLLQGVKLSRMLRLQSEHVARSYVEANSIGQAWLLRFCAEHGVPVETRDAVTFAATPDERSAARAEHDAATKLGLDTSWLEEIEAPFPTSGGVMLCDQAQIDPLPLLAELAGQLTAHGGAIRENSRVVAVSRTGRPVVSTEDGLVVRCDDVVLGTGTPILDRGLYFAKVEANRSYVLTFSGVEDPGLMLLSAGATPVSVRGVTGSGGDPVLMVGGSGHVVGRTTSERRQLGELRSWVADRFPSAIETHAWSAQDYSSHDGIPFVGKLPRGRGRIHLATGYDKWGLTNGVAAALRITGAILGDPPSWARPMDRRVTRPSGAFAMAAANARVGTALVRGLVAAELRAAVSEPAEGHGEVGRSGVDPRPDAASTVDGRTCTVVGLCTHLGGVLKWNDEERSWDCPLHGSRFAPDGSVLEGPATRPLHVRKSVDRVPGDHEVQA